MNTSDGTWKICLLKSAFLHSRIMTTLCEEIRWCKLIITARPCMQSSINIPINERSNPFIIKQYKLRNINYQAASMSHDIWRSCDWSIHELHGDVLFGGSEPFFHRILWDVYLCYTILKLYQPVNLMRKGIWFNKRDMLAHFKTVLKLFGCFCTELLRYAQRNSP